MPKSIFSSELLTTIRDSTWQHRELDLSDQNLTTENIIDLTEALKSNIYLKSLVLRSTYIDEKGILALAANTTLLTLDVSYTGIGDRGAQILAANATLTTLYANGNNITPIGARALAANKTLANLDVHNNWIGDEGAQAWETNTTLKTLGASFNQIGDTGAQALASSISLTALCIRMNKVGDKGAQALAANTTLAKLDLIDNQIGDKGAKAWAGNTTLTELWVAYNKMSDDSKQTVELIAVQNRKRLTNVAGLATAVACFRTEQHSEIKSSIVPLIPHIFEYVDFGIPTIQMDKIIGATFFKNLVRDAAQIGKREETKQKAVAGQSATLTEAHKRKYEESNEASSRDFEASKTPYFSDTNVKRHAKDASTSSSSSLRSSPSSSQQPAAASSILTEIKAPKC